MKRKHLKTDQNHPAVKAYVAALKRAEQNRHIWFENGHWIVQRDLDGELLGEFNTQEEAVAFADGQAKELRNSMFLHGDNGTILERRDYDL